ncbi:MAG: protein-glutamate O-methyltransferase CheR [Sulfurimonas sp.]|uniref:CheR family methyltransferase n=1 Tax=Sulfurimonas sp. TaxID=2022749 RepID=UPI0025F2BC57|nr:CheR family methyltransferase [Sulfurimonas sp.]MCK9491108.1 protein-glutamate O-methyltransferase CheR [Sulfurimonas sp.]
MFSFFRKKEKKILDEVREEEPTDYSDATKIAEYFKNETGVTFDKQMNILNNKAMTFCKQREISSFSKLLDLLDSDAVIKQELIDYLTTNETFFYREFKQIEELVGLVKKDVSLVKIMCAPSSTGEEPYSIAIALLEAGVSADKFRILGIDINSDALNKAQKAVYKQRNVRNLSDEIIQRYFYKQDDKFILRDSIKSLVDFKLINIFDASFATLGKFDYIFSRNMFIYFDAQTKVRAKKILQDMRKNQDQKIFFGHADEL